MLKIDERHLEDLLFEQMQTTQGIERLHSKGLTAISYQQTFENFRQLNLKEYGIPDIVRVSIEGKRRILVDVIELKVSDFCVDHLLQIGRYVSGVRHIIEESNLADNLVINVNAVLICSGFDTESNLTWLDRLLTDITIYSTDYCIDGIRFRKMLPVNGWHLTEPPVSIYNYIDPKRMKALYKRAFNNPIDDLPF